MPGYHLIEERMLQPYNPDGIAPHPERLGFLDYMRELRQEQFPFPRSHKLMVVGLEEVLLAAGDHLDEVEGFIHDTMARRANELDAVMSANVQVVFRSPLQRADDFWARAGINGHLSLRCIFGSPSRQHGPNGTEFYFVGFNLT
jgi:hypothetical protein